MSPTEAPRLPRFVTSITGPGDPIWRGKPDRDRARRIRRMTATDASGRQYFYGLRRLKTAEDYAHLNRLLDAGLG